jgi:hypothetical protein
MYLKLPVRKVHSAVLLEAVHQDLQVPGVPQLFPVLPAHQVFQVRSEGRLLTAGQLKVSEEIESNQEGHLFLRRCQELFEDWRFFLCSELVLLLEQAPVQAMVPVLL